MKKRTKRLLSVILSIIMVFSLIPVNGYAEANTGTFQKITNLTGLTTGKYVMIVNSGYAVGTFDSAAGYLGATQLSAAEDEVVNPDSSLVWTLTVNGDQVTMMDAAGVSVKPKAANSNGIAAGDYTWTFVENNGSFQIKAADADAVMLASNAGVQNKFRAYKTATALTYPNTFTLYKLGETDPITTIEAGAVSIPEAISSIPNDKEITVEGQLVYRFGNYDTPNSAILEDVVDGKICALQVYDALTDFAIGDVITVTGTMSTYKGVPQIGTLTDKKLIISASNANKIPAQEFTSIDDMLAAKDNLLSEWVLLKNITLGEYNGSGDTKVTDASGSSINIYSAATYPSGVVAGDKVDLYACLSLFKTTSQLRVGSSTDYVVNKDTKAPEILLPSFNQAEIGKDYPVKVTITDNVAVSGAALLITINSAATEIPMVQNGSDASKWEATVSGSALSLGVSSFTLGVRATDQAGNVTNSETKEIQVLDLPQVVSVAPERNAVTGDNKKPVISVSVANSGTAPTAKLTLKNGDNKKLDGVSMQYSNGTFSYTPSDNLEDARYTASVEITREDSKTTIYEWPFTVGAAKYSLYFGQLHSHTTYSDGAGSLDDALQYIHNINEKDNIDFVAFTDHSNYFDSKTEVNPEASLYDKSLMTAASQKTWDEFKTKIKEFNTSAENKGVIALGGFEMTWSGGPGHINTFNTAGVVSRNNTTLNSKTNDAGMKAYYALLSQSEGANTVNQFNHPGTTFGTFSDFAYWDPTIDSRMDLVEVGNGEGAIGSGGYFPSYNYYTMALDKGWHLAPTNNQDNHKGKWGNANDARDVILTDDFSEQGIYDALKAHRVYATEDKNLEIHYTVNDELLGSIIQDVPKSLDVKVTLNDPDDAIQKAEIIANSGRVVYTWDVNANSKELSATLSPDYSYYYVRVTEKDGDLAVTAPVWVGKTIMLGISNVEGSTSTPVTNEKMTVKTTLFNSEEEDVTVKSLTYKLDGAVIDQVSDAGTVKKASNFSVNYEFTPTKAKIQKITVEAVLTLKGIDYSFTKDLSLDVRDSNRLVYVGIDGSHYNEYVTGNYKDSMGNFSNLAAQNNVRCVILNTKEELLAAAKNESGKYQMLVLTAPSRRNGTSLREPYATYSDDEIAAIKAFAEQGGSLVICGWSDLYENYKEFPADDHMAAQQNKLLEALGSSLRISDDGAYDDVLNAGGSESNKARLYLTTYNWENPLTAGIVYDAEHPNDNIYTQRFSQYGGATIYAVGKDGKPTETLPSTVSPVVYGHSTTYSKDCDNDGLGGSATPKYTYAEGDNRLMVLASETVTHTNGLKSMIIVDGAAFMSNFEIQATVADTNAELNYSNYNILQNVIEKVNPIQIDSIANVQKEKEEGVKFTVEGIVTSNASGYDKTTAFFDCIYLQDGTAGINAFPVSGSYQVGQKVRVTGTTSSYQGERQLNVTSISLINKNVTEVQPLEVTADDINNKTYLGSLVKISGTVESFERSNGEVQTILIKDKSGKTARVFIDGYITTGKEIKGLSVGSQITVVGLSSYDNTFSGLAARIRVRDRADITCTDNGDSPIVAPVPEKGTPVVIDKAESKVVNGKANVSVEISEKALKNSGKDENGNVTLSLGQEALKEALTDKQVKKGVVVDIKIPTVKDTTVKDILLDKEALLLAKDAGQKMTIRIQNADAKGYTVSIPASELKKVSDASSALNLSVQLEKETATLRVGNEGELAVGMSVTVPVSDTLSMNAGDKVYIYRKNPETGKLEEVPNNRKTVSEKGNLQLSTLSGGEFVLRQEKETNVVRLVDKVKVTAKSSLAKGNSLIVSASLPSELAQVKSFKKGDPIGQEEAKVVYKVNDKSVATISADGTLKAKKAGKVKVSVVVTLENKEKKTYTKTITVK